MGLISRTAERQQEGVQQSMALDVQFLARRPAAFLLNIEGDWDTARQMLDCLRKAQLSDTASFNLQAIGETEELSITVQVQPSEQDASVGTMFEKAGKVIKSLEEGGLIKGIQLW